MLKRQRMKKSKDVGVFKKTYNHTKAINRGSAKGFTGTRF